MAETMAQSSRTGVLSAGVWIRQIAEGDTGALDALYEATHVALYGYILSFLKNEYDAQDALHDCYMAVAQHAISYQDEGKPMAWMYTIARNRCMQVLRERRKTMDIADEEPLWSAPARPDLAVDDRAVLTVCMNGLSGEERRIVLMHVLAGFRHREIAEFMDMPLSTVLSKYHRALQKMKYRLKEEYAL